MIELCKCGQPLVKNHLDMGHAWACVRCWRFTDAPVAAPYTDALVRARRANYLSWQNLTWDCLTPAQVDASEAAYGRMCDLVMGAK